VSYPPVIVQVLLVLIVIPAAFFDYRSRRVPNWLSLAGVLLGIGLNFFLYETPGLWTSLKGMGVAFGIYFVLYLLRAMGAGDVKLMAAVGAIVGLWNWVGILVITSVFGGLAALVLVSKKGRLRTTFRNIWLILTSLGHRQAPYETNPELDVRNEQAVRLPHAVSICFGAMAFLIAAYIWAPR
jgi:prepilin peptidase CpaA